MFQRCSLRGRASTRGAALSGPGGIRRSGAPAGRALAGAPERASATSLKEPKHASLARPKDPRATALYHDLAELILHGRGRLTTLPPRVLNDHIQVAMTTLLLTPGYPARVRELYAALDDIRLFGPCDSVAPQSLRNTYYLGRHGTSDANARKIISSGPRALIDHGLTSAGFDEVSASSSALAAILKSAKIVASPLSRASETAFIHAQAVGAGRITCDMRLRERYFGALDGQPIEQHPCVWEKDQVCAPGLGIEAPVRVRDRVVSLIGSLEAEHTGEVFAFITHSATAQITEAWFRGMEPDRHRELPPMRNGELRLMVAGERKG